MNRDIWILDLVRGSTQHLVADPADDFNPVWSPDGTRIVFTSNRKGARDLYIRSASGGGEETPLLESGHDKNAEDWSPDSRFVAFNRSNILFAMGSNLWVVPMEGAERKPFAIETSRFYQTQLRFSPDSRWIAHVSAETGQNEIFIQPFPPTGARYRVSNAGGREPQWRADGQELFYIAGSKLMAVDINTAAGKIGLGMPRVLFEAPLGPLGPRNRYLVSRDGKRFLIPTPMEDQSTKGFTVIVDWPALLKR